MCLRERVRCSMRAGAAAATALSRTIPITHITYVCGLCAVWLHRARAAAVGAGAREGKLIRVKACARRAANRRPGPPAPSSLPPPAPDPAGCRMTHVADRAPGQYCNIAVWYAK